jgi:5-methylthioribose kinase
MIILNPDNLHHYLLENGSLTIDAIVDGSYSVSQSRTRNITFQVNGGTNKHLFIKQLTAFDQMNKYILQKDATCLWLIKNEPAFKKLSAFVPNYYGFDTTNEVLITEFLPDARNLEHHFRIQDSNVGEYLQTLTEILTSFHFPLTDKIKGLPSMRFFKQQLPWALTFGMPDSQNQNGQSPVLNRVINNPDYKAMLKDARGMYEFTSLIHGDIKWMNFLIIGDNKDAQLKLIDWEIADVGDPLWDVGGLIMSILMLSAVDGPYQHNKKINPSTSMDERLSPCWPIIIEFWKLYAKKSSFKYKNSIESFNKALHFAGARLIQTAVEFNMNSAEMYPLTEDVLAACISLFTHKQSVLEMATRNGIKSKK